MVSSPEAGLVGPVDFALLHLRVCQSGAHNRLHLPHFIGAYPVIPITALSANVSIDAVVAVPADVGLLEFGHFGGGACDPVYGLFCVGAGGRQVRETGRGGAEQAARGPAMPGCQRGPGDRLSQCWGECELTQMSTVFCLFAPLDCPCQVIFIWQQGHSNFVFPLPRRLLLNIGHPESPPCPPLQPRAPRPAPRAPLASQRMRPPVAPLPRPPPPITAPPPPALTIPITDDGFMCLPSLGQLAAQVSPDSLFHLLQPCWYCCPEVQKSFSSPHAAPACPACCG